MKTVLHKADERGAADHGWLKTHHSFSFAGWYKSDRMGYGALRVLNDDMIAPLSGFPLHGHRDMEIITVVTQGVVTHSDSLGNRKTVRAGEVQVMSAGTGVIHAEENASAEETLKLFQIWIKPRAANLPPHYAQKAFDFSRAGLALLSSPDAVSGSLPIQQEAWIFHAHAKKGAGLCSPPIGPSQGLYIFVTEGEWKVGDVTLGPKDALGISEVGEVELVAKTDASALLFDVPLF